MTFIASGVGIAANVGMSMYSAQQAKKSAKKQEAAVKAAIADRERKINSIYDRMGASGKAAIDRSTQDGLGQATQSGIDRGLGNTSVMDTMQGVARGNGLQAQLALQDQLARGRAGALSDLPIAVPEKPAGMDTAGLFSASLGQLGGLLNKIPGSNPNQVQNTVQGLGGNAPSPYSQRGGEAVQAGAQDAFVPPPPAPAQLAGSTYAPAPAKRRGVYGYAGQVNPYAGR